MKRNIERGPTDLSAPAVRTQEFVEKMPSEFLAPMLAGARARGIADAYEMMGLGAVLLNDSGRVLHASGRARRMMEGVIELVSEHLVAATPEANASIGQLIAAGLSGAQNQSDPIVLAVGGRRLSLRAAAAPAHENGAFQLLKAVLVLSEA